MFDHLALKERLTRSSAVRAVSFLPKTLLNKWQDYVYARSKWPEDIRQFKDLHKGEECFVIGNGPSLTIEDLEKLQGKYTFCSNYLYRLFDEMSFRPTYYVAGDPFFFPEGFNELICYEGIEDYFMAPKDKFFECPHVHKINVSGPFTVVKGSLKSDDFSSDPSRYLALSYTVTYYSLQLAAYMGFETIYLLGVDHKYAMAVDERGRMKKTSENDESYASGIAPEKKPGWNYIDSTTYSYITARKYADSHGIRILNATRGGELEVFERVDFDDIV